MVSLTENFPGCYLNGNCIAGDVKEKRISTVSSVSSYRDALGTLPIDLTVNCSDSDVDCTSMGYSVAVSRQHPSKPDPSVHSNSKKDESLMQWLMLQFEQHGLDGTALPTSDRVLESNDSLKQTVNHNLSASIPKLPTKSEKATAKRDNSEPWVQSCPRLERNRKINGHYYPRLPRSTNNSREALTMIPRKCVSKACLTNVGRLLDELEGKTHILQQQNEALNSTIHKANNIIRSWHHDKCCNNTKYGHNHVLRTTINSPMRRREALEGNGQRFAIIKSTFGRDVVNILPNTYCYDAERPSSPSPMNSWTKRPIFHQQAGCDHKNSPSPHNLQSPQMKNLCQTNGSINNRDLSMEHLQLPLRRYSTAYDSIHQQTLAETEQNLSSSAVSKVDASVQNSPSKFPKPSWSGPTFSQLTMQDRGDDTTLQEDGNHLNGRATPIGSQTTLNSQGPSAKGLAALILRPFRRKASTPGPGHMTISPPVLLNMTTRNRSLSLIHLSGTKHAKSLSSETPDSRQRSAQTYLQMCENRMYSEEILQTGQHGKTSHLRNKVQLPLGKHRTRKEGSADSGIGVFYNAWRT